MIVEKCICDHCGQIIEDNNRFHVSYIDHNETDLCKVCYEEFINRFSNWLKNELVKDCEKKIEDYEKAIHNYQQQIIDLKEELDKTKISRDWWKNRCNGNLS